MRCIFKQAVPSVRETPYDKVELLRLPAVGKSPLVVCSWCQVKVKSPSHIRLFATHGLYSTSLLNPWNFPGGSTGVGCHFLLQGIFPTQGLNLGLPHCRQTLYPLSHQGSPWCHEGLRTGYQITVSVLQAKNQTIRI